MLTFSLGSVMVDGAEWHIRLVDGDGTPCGQWLSKAKWASLPSVVEYANAVARNNPWMCAVHARIERW